MITNSEFIQFQKKIRTITDSDFFAVREGLEPPKGD